MLARSLCLLSVLLLTACATGADGEEDGVITRGDARADGGEEGDDTSTTGNDTGSSGGEDTSSPPVDSGRPEEDTGSPVTDTGPGPTDTGPKACSGEEPEPNDSPTNARTLAAIDDCDGSGKTVSGVLSTPSDVDLLTYDGSDTFGCSVNAYAKITGPVVVCIKAACKSGTTEPTCKTGTKTGTECCGTEAEMDINCTGTSSDDAKITMTVRGDGSSFTCAAYSLSYHY